MKMEEFVCFFIFIIIIIYFFATRKDHMLNTIEKNKNKNTETD